MEGQQFEEINEKLEKITKLLALQLSSNKNNTEFMKSLASAGFKPKEIARLIGTTPNTVSVSLHKIKKGKRHAKKE